MTVYRIQDRFGRGPYRPGFTNTWADEDRSLSQCPSVFQEFGSNPWRDIRKGEHCGCAFDSISQLRAWFSDAELEKLFFAGYSCVELEVDRVLAQSAHQLVFARRRPLRKVDRFITLFCNSAGPTKDKNAL